MRVNTTEGIKIHDQDLGPDQRNVQTSRVVEEDVIHEDAEIIQTLIPRGDWVATYEDGSTEHVDLWLVLDDDTLEACRIKEGEAHVKLDDYLSRKPGFTGYRKINASNTNNGG